MRSRGAGRLVIRRGHNGLKAREMIAIVRLATTASLQPLVETASWLGLARILSTIGSAAWAGYTIAMRVADFALLPSFSFLGLVGLAFAAMPGLIVRDAAVSPHRDDNRLRVAMRALRLALEVNPSRPAHKHDRRRLPFWRRAHGALAQKIGSIPAI